MEFPCFLYDPVNVGNLISGSSAFSKPSLYIWKFSVHILLKPSLKDFEHNLTSMWNECNCLVVELWHCSSSIVVVVQSLSCVQLFATSWTAAHQAFLSFPNSWSVLKPMSIAWMMPSNCLILCHPLLFLPSIFPSIRVLSSELAVCIRWPKYQSFSISPSSEYSGFNLLAVQGTLRSLLQHCCVKASILWCSAFFMVQLSHPYMTTGKTVALTRQTFVSAF